MTTTTNAATDCPACPACGLTTGTAEGCRGAWLLCAACGHLWEASAEDHAKAKRADAAHRENIRAEERAGAWGEARKAAALAAVCPRCLGSHAEGDAETGERLPCTACFGMSRRPTEGELREEVRRLRAELLDARVAHERDLRAVWLASGETIDPRADGAAVVERVARLRELFAESADAFDGLVLKVWRAATGDEHEGPASVDDLLATLRKVRAERNVAFAAGVDAARSMCADYCAARAEVLDAAAGEDPDPDDPEVAENFGRFAEAHELSTALRVLQRPDMEEALRAIDARVAAETAARHSILDGLREALAAGVGKANGDFCEKAAATDEAMRVAFDRWEAVAVHGIVGLALYERGDGPGGFVFKRFATQEEDDAFIACHQTNLAALLAWRKAAMVARREGAEAMREAAAQVVERSRFGARGYDPQSAAAEYVIRALPLPEVTP